MREHIRERGAIVQSRRNLLKGALSGIAFVASEGYTAGAAPDGNKDVAVPDGPSDSTLIMVDAYCSLGVDREYDLTEDDLLRALDQAKVHRAVIAPTDRYIAIYNREGNHYMVKAASAHRDRFIPSCSVNPWYGKAAVRELRRALGEGARLLVLHPLVQGFVANDELVFPLLEEAADERVPVYFHTGPPGNASPWQLVDLAARFPSADFIMGHCGATDFWNDAVLACRSAANLYLESSLARPFNFASALDQLDRQKGIMGSGAPLNNLVFEWEQTRKLLAARDWLQVFGANLVSLLGKRGAL